MKGQGKEFYKVTPCWFVRPTTLSVGGLCIDSFVQFLVSLSWSALIWE